MWIFVIRQPTFESRLADCFFFFLTLALQIALLGFLFFLDLTDKYSNCGINDWRIGR